MNFLVNEKQCVRKVENWKIETKFTDFWGAVFEAQISFINVFIWRNLWQWIWLWNTDIYGSSLFFVDL